MAKFLKALNSEASPWQIALGITLGLIVGLTPLMRLHNLVILFLLLFFRINIASFLVAFGFFSGLAYLLDPVMISLGESVLTAGSLQDLWTAWYNSSVGRLSQFNHTLTMGSLVLSLLASPLVLLASRYLVLQYRQRLMVWVSKLKLVQALKASRLYQIYESLGN
nr:TIGR03546 family protein [Bowmanella dokdonensis]